MKLSSRDLMIVVVAAIAVVAILFVVFAIVPQFNELSALDAAMLKAQGDITAAQQLLASRQGAKAQAAETQAQLTRLDNEIPDAPELPTLIIDLQDAANDAGVVMDTLSPGRPSAPADGYQKISLGFNVTGQWDDAVDFLRRLSELNRGVRVLSSDVVLGTPLSSVVASGSVVASNSVAPAVKNEVRLTLSVETYMLPRSGSASGAPTAGP